MTAFALASGCASPPSKPISIEARGGLDGRIALGLAEAALRGLGAGGGAGSISAAATDSTGYHDDHEPTFVRDFGVRASVNTPFLDLVGGVEQYSIDKHYLPQESLGLRKRVHSSTDDYEAEQRESASSLYAEVLLIHGHGARTDSGREDYDAVGIGIGALNRVSDHWFVDFSLEFERTLQRLEFDGDNAHQSSVALHIGVGYSF